MNEINNSPACERASDLIAFLYNETDENETRDFGLHLQQCGICREEVAAFQGVRESITAWRDEALAGFVSTPLAVEPNRKSALAALRQFFELSPLWLKGAAAFAVVVFCVLVALVFKLQHNSDPVSVAKVNPDAVYTRQDVDRMLKEALPKQENAPAPVPSSETATTSGPSKRRNEKTAGSSQTANSRRPLSRAERDRLAADLRLFTDDADLNLIGDRINRQ
jgi:hypothetical protein